MRSPRTDRSPLNRHWDDLPAAGWHEFAAARRRFFATLEAQAAEAASHRRLPGREGGRYDRAPAGEDEGACSQ